MRTFNSLIITMMIIFLAGCGPVKMPPVSTYTISGVPTTVKVRRTRTNRTLLVSVPVASPGYQSNKMAYVTVPFRLRYFSRNAWVAPPAEMLVSLLTNTLTKTNSFKAVVTTPFAGVVNYRLDTHLLMLQQEFLHPTSQVRLIIQATVINNQTSRVMASHRFQAVVDAPQNNPYSGVLATNEAAAKLSQQITQFVLNTVR